jgi:CheY-like chemotaxis protein
LRENGFTGPIIGVTAATIGEERDKLIAAGANAAIGKPLTKEKLLDTLAALYDHKEQIDS